MKTYWVKEKKKKHWTGRDIGSNVSSFIYQLCYFTWVQIAFWKGQWKVNSTSVIILMQSCGFMGFPSGSAGKDSACNAGDLGSIPGLGRYPGEGKGYPLQYSCLENSMDGIAHVTQKVEHNWVKFTFHKIAAQFTFLPEVYKGFSSPHHGLNLLIFCLYHKQPNKAWGVDLHCSDD